MPMSSPRQKTVGSFSISSQIPWRMASRYVSWGIGYELADGLLQMRGCLCGLVLAASCLNLRPAVLRLDRVTSLFAIHAALCRFRRRHRRVHGDLAFFFNCSLDLSDQVRVLFGRKPFLVAD